MKLGKDYILIFMCHALIHFITLTAAGKWPILPAWLLPVQLLYFDITSAVRGSVSACIDEAQARSQHSRSLPCLSLLFPLSKMLLTNFCFFFFTRACCVIDRCYGAALGLGVHLPWRNSALSLESESLFVSNDPGRGFCEPSSTEHHSPFVCA